MPRAARAAASEPKAQPHDRLFKWTFSRPEHAAGLLRAALPEAWAQSADFSTLRHEPGSFVSQALQSRHSDLLFSIRMRGQKLYFYVLISARCCWDGTPVR